MRRLVAASILIVLIAACSPASPTPIRIAAPTPTPTWTSTSTPTVIPTPTYAPTTYMVQPADTLARIAAEYGTTAEALCIFNALTNCDLITPGQELLIPSEGMKATTSGALAAPTDTPGRRDSPTAIPPTPIPPTPTACPEPATPTTALVGTSDVQIECIFYDGRVYRVESDEYVQITNFGTAAQELEGWRLADVSEGYPSLVFPPYIVGPGVSIRVYTNERHPEWGGFSFSYGKAVWNNKEPDVAALYNAQGQEVSRKSYPPGCY